MATAPDQSMLPLFYKDLVPFHSSMHASWKARPLENLSMLESVHAIPLTTDEFIPAQRSFPIVFSAAEDPVPLALFGLNDGVNTFIDAEGQLAPGTYLPAYMRRYPFMLARLQPDAEEMSLCFDPTPNLLGDFEDGVALFENGQPSPALKQSLEFCEQFEMAAQRTAAFAAELKGYELLTEGEFSVQLPNAPQPYVYRGFQIVNEEKLKELRGDQLRKMQQSGMLPLLHAHIFSLQLLQTVFERQHQQGKVPLQL